MFHTVQVLADLDPMFVSSVRKLSKDVPLTLNTPQKRHEKLQQQATTQNSNTKPLTAARVPLPS